jgi:phosphoribosylformylglycinamidine synthase
MTVSVGVVTFPGSLDDRDALRAIAAAGAEPISLWHKDPSLHGVDAVVLPGGFSYGDYLRCGAIARFSPVMDLIIAGARDGLPVLGICNGFQVLCEAGLVPGALRQNRSLSFICRDVTLRVERADTPFTSRCEPQQRLVVPIKNNEGCWFADDETVTRMEANGQILLRYHGENPSGSVMAVAGVCNEAGNVMGLMPHPEHAVDPLLGSGDGALILASLVDAARERITAAV